MGTKHENLVAPFIHAVPAKIFADIAARDADSAFQVTANINKLVRVDSPLSYFILASIGPAVWLEFSSTGFDTWAEVLAGGNESGGTDPIVSGGDILRVTDNMTVGGIANPSSSVSIDLQATTAALLLNRLTTTQRDALTPLAGMEIFNTTTLRAEGYNGTSWVFADGDVRGPGSSTDNALVRYDLATGKLIQNSLAILDDLGALSGLTQLDVDNLRFDGNTLSTIAGDLNLSAFSGFTGVGIPAPVTNLEVSEEVRVSNPGNQSFFASFLRPSGGFAVSLLQSMGTKGIAFRNNGGIGTGTFADVLSNLNTDVFAHGGQLSVGSLTLDASAQVAFSSTTQGFLPMTMTTTQKDAITSPATGLLVDDLTLNSLQRFDGSGWQGVSGDFVGPGSSGLNNIVRFGDTTGKLGKDSDISITDAAAIVSLAHTNPTAANLANLIQYKTFLNVTTAGLLEASRIETQFSDIGETTNNSNLNFYMRTGGTLFERMRLSGSGPVRIGGGGDGQGILNVIRAPSGATVNPLCQELVVEHLFDAGLSILTGDTGRNRICFGDVSNNSAGVIIYDHGSDLLSILGLGDIRLNPIGGKVTVSSTANVGLLVENTLGGTSPSYMEFKNPAQRARMGYLSNDFTLSAIQDTQIGAIQNGGLVYASRGNFAGGGHKFYTPNAALDTLIERLSIADLTGQTIINSTVENVLRLLSPTLQANFISFEPNGARHRAGYFGFSAIPLTITECQIGCMGNGKVIIATRGNFSGGGISLLSYDGTTELKEAMLIEDGTDGNPGTLKLLSGIKTHKTNVADANYTIISSDFRIAVTSITAARIITIPTAEIAKGSATEAREWKFKDQSGSVSGANTITIATEGAETIDGASSLVVNTPFFDFSLYADGSNVYVEAA